MSSVFYNTWVIMGRTGDLGVAFSAEQFIAYRLHSPLCPRPAPGLIYWFCFVLACYWLDCSAGSVACWAIPGIAQKCSARNSLLQNLDRSCYYFFALDIIKM